MKDQASPANDAADESSSEFMEPSSSAAVTAGRRSLLIAQKIEQSFRSSLPLSAGEDPIDISLVVQPPKDSTSTRETDLEGDLTSSEREGGIHSSSSRPSLLSKSSSKGLKSNLSVRWGDNSIDAESDSEGSSIQRFGSSTLLSSSDPSSSLRSSSSSGRSILKRSSSGSSRRNVQGKESDTLLPPTTGAALDAVFFHGKADLAATVIQETFRRRAAVHENMQNDKEPTEADDEGDRIRGKESSNSGVSSTTLSGTEGTSGRENPSAEDQTEEEEEEEKEPVDRSALYMFLFVGIFGMGLVLFKVITKCIERFKGEDPVDNVQQVADHFVGEIGVDVIGNVTASGSSGGGAGGTAGGTAVVAGGGVLPPMPP
jgi:hypothetical protein